MFYRRKIILGLLQTFNGHLPKISLQKLLFLFSERQSDPEYRFVPYYYGCYSFSANADLTTMVRKGYLAEDFDNFKVICKQDFICELKESDRKVLRQLKKEFADFSPLALMKLTYHDYPYYAINSIKAKEIVGEEQYSSILNAKPVGKDIILFTIGYEGISLEEYFNRLIKNDVKVLVDVRNNPLSMKFGFSKKKLETFCSALNIEYLHIPEVGIQSSQRKNLVSQNEYDVLFDRYKHHTLTNTLSHQTRLLTLLKDKKRIALTCFEANICQCHRLHLAQAVSEISEWKFEIKHI